ncbi:hypothetical protein GMJAKD_08350 [Candidatus Electrothrix aarhusensis]
MIIGSSNSPVSQCSYSGRGNPDRLLKKASSGQARPINDITLADHAISTAALAAAQAARLVLETSIAVKVTENMYYSLPVRRKQSRLAPQETSFAVFSCAINADKLDQMALELKDITALREEVKKLLEYFLTLFSEKHPVGGAVYQDQHGAHMVLPILGESDKTLGATARKSLHLLNGPEMLLTSAGSKATMP